MTRPHIIYSGRFQPYHLGHLAVTRAVLNEFEADLIIGVVLFELRASSHDPLSDRLHPVNNPFSFWEIRRMIRETIKEAGLVSNRPISVLPIPQLERWWTLADRLLPTERVWLIPADRETKQRTVDLMLLFERLGESYKIFDPPPRQFSGTTIRHRLATSVEWKSMVPGSVANILEELNAGNRLRNLYLRYQIKPNRVVKKLVRSEQVKREDLRHTDIEA